MIWAFDICILLLIFKILPSTKGVNAGCHGHREGEQWNEGNCKLCFCHRKSVMCGSICGRGKAISDVFQSSSTQNIRNNLIANALSNSNRDSCFHDGKTRSHKESWIETSHHARSVTARECMLCHCSKRIVSCTIRSCPPLTCKNPIRKEGSCCQYCPEHDVKLTNDKKRCSSFGSLFNQDNKWKVYVPNNEKNECLSCSCQKTGCKSSLTCQRLVCPILSCVEQVYRTGYCCKTCKDGNQHAVEPEDQMYIAQSSGFDLFDSLKDSSDSGNEDNDCNEDISHENRRQFNKKKVQQLKIESVKGPTDCDFGRIYKDGESFIPERFECLRCTCKNSNVTCGKVFCPSHFTCKNPTYREGVCCKVCPGMSSDDALKIENKDVRPLKKRRKSCGTKKDNRIQVFEYLSPSSLLNGRILNNYFLFDRSQLVPPNDSEIHSIKFRAPSFVEVTVSRTSGVHGPLASKWKYIGSIKAKILERIHRHEKSLIASKSLVNYNNLVKMIKQKAGKGGNRRGARCERKSSYEDFFENKLFRTLKEVK